MKYIITAMIGMLVMPHVVAASVVFNTLAEPYETYELSTDLPHEQQLYGELDEYPDTYQFRLTSTTTVTFTPYAVDETESEPLFSGIVVAEEGGRGVREIARLLASEMTWGEYQDPLTKMSYQQGEGRSVSLDPGLYRVEISTPDNDGKYRLDVSGVSTESTGYFATIDTIRSVQNFHGAGWWNLLRTAPIQMPLLIMVILIGMYMTWRYAKRRQLIAS